MRETGENPALLDMVLWPPTSTKHRGRSTTDNPQLDYATRHLRPIIYFASILKGSSCGELTSFVICGRFC